MKEVENQEEHEEVIRAIFMHHFFKLIDCQELVYLNTLFSDLYLEELTQFFHLITFKFSETAV